MIKKERAAPIIIFKLEALLRRLKPGHPSREKIADELARRQAGVRGEKKLDYFVQNLPLSKEGYVFHDLRLPITNMAYFQMDTLIVTPQFLLVFEGKNISGELSIELNQLVRTIEEKVDVFPNPILQAENQLLNLHTLLMKHSIPCPPSDYYVVIANPHSIIKHNPHYPAVSNKVIRPAAIRNKVYLMSKKSKRSILDKRELSNLSRILLKLHTPEEPDVLSRYKIDSNDIVRGGYCESCKQFSVKRINRFWTCTQCQIIGNYAMFQALWDYRLLMGKTITNRKFREFLMIDSIDMASNMLRRLKFPSTGKFKSTEYELEVEILRERLELE